MVHTLVATNNVDRSAVKVRGQNIERHIVDQDTETDSLVRAAPPLPTDLTFNNFISVGAPSTTPNRPRACPSRCRQCDQRFAGINT